MDSNPLMKETFDSLFQNSILYLDELNRTLHSFPAVPDNVQEQISVMKNIWRAPHHQLPLPAPLRDAAALILSEAIKGTRMFRTPHLISHFSPEKNPDDSELGLSVCFLGPLIDLPLRFIVCEILQSKRPELNLRWSRGEKDPIEFPKGLQALLLPDGLLSATVEGHIIDLVCITSPPSFSSSFIICS